MAARYFRHQVTRGVGEVTMRRLLRRSCFIAAPVLAMGAFSLSPVAAAAANGGSSTCQVGSVAAGTYSNLNIAGFCAIDSGNVTVLQT